MNRLARFLALVSLVSVMAVPVSGQQSAAQAPSAAAAHARELAALIDAGDYRAAADYIRESYAPEFLAAAPMQRHLTFLFEGRPHGVTVHEVETMDTTTAAALLENNLTGDYVNLHVRTTAEPPHRIAGLRASRADRPDGREPDPSLTDAQIQQHLRTYLRDLADADVFSGAVLVARRGRPIFRAAYGEANRDFAVPNQTDTKFNLGSMNKMFTAVAVMQLVEAGRLSLDDPLARYLPTFPSREAAEKIEIRHLLTHTAGLGSYFGEAFQQASRARFRTVDDFMALAEGDSLRFEPGTDWRYSNTGFLVLGKVIEEVTGESYFDYVRNNIYEPAGMTNTGAFELDHVNENLAVGYQKEYTEDGVRYRNNLFDHVIRGGPAGGGYSTVDDLLRFAEALRAGELVGESYVDMMLSPKPEISSPRYGFGFGVDTEEQIAGHSGGFIGISSNLDLFLGSGYTAVVLSNYGRGSRPVVSRIRDLVQPAV